MSSCDGFNCFFPRDVEKGNTAATKILLLSLLFYCFWLVYLLGSWLRNAPLVRNPISESMVFKNELTHFTLLDT